MTHYCAKMAHIAVPECQIISFYYLLVFFGLGSISSSTFVFLFLTTRSFASFSKNCYAIFEKASLVENGFGLMRAFGT